MGSGTPLGLNILGDPLPSLYHVVPERKTQFLGREMSAPTELNFR